MPGRGLMYGLDWSSAESVGGLSGGLVGAGGLDLIERVAKRLVAEHRALEPRRADLDTEEIEEIVGAECLDVGQRLALDLVGEKARARLADGTSASGEPDPLDHTIPNAELER